MRIASLRMYTSSPELAQATDRLWVSLNEALANAGMGDVPRQLDTAMAHDAAWVHPGLLLAQACGFPYVKQLQGKVRLVATPAYGYPGCEGPLACSFIVVGRRSGFRSLEDLRGARAAINDPMSNSGCNLFRALVAPLAKGGRFFGSILKSGGHLASMQAVTEGRADVAAIDCVTFGNVQRFLPERLAGLRVIAETVKGPGLPLVTGPCTTDAELSLLRAALQAVLRDPDLAQMRETLCLRDFDELGDADYRALAELERQAASLGYPVLA